MKKMIKRFLVWWNQYLDERKRKGKKPFYKTKRFWIVAFIVLLIMYPDQVLSSLLYIIILIEEVLR